MTPTPDYVERVNRAIDYIVTHVADPLQLEDLARIACFSPFHFHRIFKLLTGETLKQFVKRVRLERALHMLSHGKEPSLTRIALECGFASSSDFSRSFKQFYGVPPSAFDLATFRDSRRQDMQRLLLPEGERHRLARLPKGENPDGFEMSIRQLPPRTVAYIRVHRPYEGEGVLRAVEQLLIWADEHGWGDNQWLGYQWEDPELVPLDKCRYDVGVEVPADFRAEGDVGRIEFPAMRVAELSMDGSIELEQRALDWMWMTWLPNSGYVPDAQPAFEAWDGRPFEDGLTRFRLRLQLPVVGA